MRVFAMGALAATIAWTLAGDQERQECELDVRTNPGSESHYVKLGEGDSRLDAGGGVEATCGEKWVRADSATYYEGRGELYLFGNVHYGDDARTLEADYATYYANEDRLRARGNVRLTDFSGGSTLTGSELEYFPETDARAEERIFAPRRPHLTFYADSSRASESEPFEIDADHIHIHGDSLVAGAGRVVAVRGDLNAFGDSMDINLKRERLWLLGSPRVDAGETVLVGDTMLVLLEEDHVKEILAWPNASARGQGMVLTAPSLRLFVEAEEIARAVASAGDSARTGAVRSEGLEPWARSESDDYVLTADSIDILRPGGQLERVIAVRRARAATVQPVLPGDGLLGRDWLEGDTVTGYFAAPDSIASGAVDAVEEDVQLVRLVASGSARALYHLRDEEASDGGNDPPGVNYVIGRVVTLWLEGGEVQEARVVGPSTGVYLEPLPVTRRGSGTSAPDSGRAGPTGSDTLPAPARRRRER